MKPLGITALLTLIACDGQQAPAPVPSRVVAVQAAEPEGEAPSTFCEVRDHDFSFPQGIEGDVEPSADGWRWINIWATWCRPCVEEMPRLMRFQQQRSDDDLDLVFLSADTNADDVQAFRQAHPSVPDGPRLPDMDALRRWLVSLGLDEGASLPVHLFIDPQGRLACARTAAIGDDDLASVSRLLGL